MTTYSKQTIAFASQLVKHYATWHDASDFYSLDTSEIPDFDLHTLAQLIMSENISWANEATGSDNPYYEKRMLPALLRHLKDSTDKELREDFAREWRNGIINYFEKPIQEMLNDICNNKLHETMNDAGFYARRKPDNGELYWSRV